MDKLGLEDQTWKKKHKNWLPYFNQNHQIKEIKSESYHHHVMSFHEKKIGVLLHFESLCQGLHDAAHPFNPHPSFQVVVDGAEALLPQLPQAAVVPAPRRAAGGQHGGELGVRSGHELAGVVDHLVAPDLMKT